ncbi:MAG TPA: hypothetical protein VNT50_08410 [Microbacterium sp.]|uniref:hypothetical protein n=1 Tax=Microbacterium sp. TaxID=51671 RepID=UPI002BE13E9A|nr:hypothetical protein [Microbacterium sp.]HWI31502.1 hypothetical protein [Microbacterium sp.]
MAPEAQIPRHRHETTSTDEIVGARVRRSPRYGAFLVFGAVLGILVAMILTFAFDGTAEPSPGTNVVYSDGQVFGFLALICISVGVLVAGVLALVLDRTVGRRTRTVVVDHETVVEHENHRDNGPELDDGEPIVLNQVDPPAPSVTRPPAPGVTPPPADGPRA